MVNVSGPLSVVLTTGTAQVSGVTVSARDTRPHGTGVLLDQQVPATLSESRVLSFSAVPGPIVITLLSGGRPLRHVKGIVPDKSDATLAEVVRAAGLADAGTLTALEELAAQVAADAARADGHASTAQGIADSLPGTIQSELDTRVPSEVAEAIAADPTVAEAAAAAVVDAVDAAMPTKADKAEVESALSKKSEVGHKHASTDLTDVSNTIGQAADPNKLVKTQADGQLYIATGSIKNANHVVNKSAMDTAITAAKWERPQVSNVDLNTLTTPGVYPFNLTGSAANIPIVGPGSLEVFGNPTYLTQRWTRWNMAKPVVYVRTRSGGEGGTWSKWTITSWQGNALVAADDLNAIPEGLFSVVSGNTKNIPIPSVGWVQQVDASGWLIQMFGTRTDQLFLRSRGGGVWSPWREIAYKDQLSALEARLGSIPSVTKVIAERNPIGVSTMVRTDVGQADYPAHMTSDRRFYFDANSPSGIMRYSDDLGKTWKQLTQFPGVYWSVAEIGNGELLARVNADGLNGMWLSDGWPTLREGATWKKVIDAHAGGIFFASGWGISAHDNVVLVAEYGAKHTATNGVPKGDNARYLWMSIDYGKTFRIILDINEYATSRPSKGDDLNLHLHGVAWDPWWDRIWVTCGDGGGAFLYSDDLGETWHTAWDGWAANAAGAPSSHQSVGIVPMPSCILFATDSSPNGVLRIDRSEGKRTGTYPIEVAYNIPEDVGRLSHLAHSAYRVERSPGDYLAMFAYGAETVDGQSFAVATYDGYEFTRFWQDDQITRGGKGVRSMIGPTMDGKVIIGSDDVRTPHKWGMWEGQFHGY